MIFYLRCVWEAWFTFASQHPNPSLSSLGQLFFLQLTLQKKRLILQEWIS